MEIENVATTSSAGVANVSAGLRVDAEAGVSVFMEGATRPAPEPVAYEPQPDTFKVIYGARQPMTIESSAIHELGKVESFNRRSKSAPLAASRFATSCRISLSD